MKRRLAIQRLTRNADALKNLGLKSVFIFGSTARGTARPASDVDILVDLRDRRVFSLFDLLEVRYRMTKILGKRADVVTRQSLHPAIKRAILAEAVRVF